MTPLTVVLVALAVILVNGTVRTLRHDRRVQLRHRAWRQRRAARALARMEREHE